MGGGSHWARGGDVSCAMRRAIMGVTAKWSAPSTINSAPPTRRVAKRTPGDMLHDRRREPRSENPPLRHHQIRYPAQPRDRLVRVGEWNAGDLARRQVNSQPHPPPREPVPPDP